MSYDQLHVIIIFCTFIVLIALASCLYHPKIEINLDFRDFVVLLAIILIGVGCFMIYPASAFIVSGSLLFWVGRPR